MASPTLLSHMLPFLTQVTPATLTHASPRDTQTTIHPLPGQQHVVPEMPAAELLEVLSPSVPWPHGGLQPGGDLAAGGRGEAAPELQMRQLKRGQRQ